MSENTLTNTELKKKDIKLKIIVYIVSILLTLMILWPIIMMLVDNFTSEVTIVPGPYGTYQEQSKTVYFMTQHPFRDFAKNWTRFARDHQGLFVGLKNSLIVTVPSTIFTLYFSALTAYAITAYEWKLKKVFDKFIIVVMMIPNTISTVGFYQLVYKYGLVNRLSMLILPAIAAPMTVFFMRMYLQATFSMEIVESARLDGAGEFRIFNQIILPMLKPAIATQAIFAFVTNWTNSYVPHIILLDAEVMTLPLIGGYTIWFSYASFIPPIIVYALCSKHIVEGVALGSVKN